MSDSSRMKLDAASRSDTGRFRTSNEDAVACATELGLFLVSDGMGGLANGARASRLAVEILHDYVTAADAPPSACARDDPNVLAEATRRANGRVWAEGRNGSSADRPLSGATLVALRVCPVHRLATWVHVGDSRLYRGRGGRLELLTADHTVAGVAHRHARSVPLDLPHSSRILQALGVERDVDPSVGTAALRDGDAFLLCTDGLSSAVEPAALQSVLCSRRDAAEAAESLLRLALAAETRDNATLIVVRTSDP
jgi:serine/threonine protein phosphatase PrpC